MINYFLDNKKVVEQLFKFIKKILNEFKDIIIKNNNNLKKINILKYKINFIYFFLIIIKLKIFNFNLQKKMKKKIQSLLKRKIIRSSNSSYLINIIIIIKKDSNIRIYIQYL